MCKFLKRKMLPWIDHVSSLRGVGQNKLICFALSQKIAHRFTMGHDAKLKRGRALYANFSHVKRHFGAVCDLNTQRVPASLLADLLYVANDNWLWAPMSKRRSDSGPERGNSSDDGCDGSDQINCGVVCRVKHAFQVTVHQRRVQ